MAHHKFYSFMSTFLHRSLDYQLIKVYTHALIGDHIYRGLCVNDAYSTRLHPGQKINMCIADRQIVCGMLYLCLRCFFRLPCSRYRDSDADEDEDGEHANGSGPSHLCPTSSIACLMVRLLNFKSQPYFQLHTPQHVRAYELRRQKSHTHAQHCRRIHTDS